MEFNNAEEKSMYENGKGVERKVSDMLNSMGYADIASVGFLDSFERDHRALQADIIQLALALLKRASELGTDARNEYYVRLAKIATNAVEASDGDIYDPDKDRRMARL